MEPGHEVGIDLIDGCHFMSVHAVAKFLQKKYLCPVASDSNQSEDFVLPLL
jgi:hypothetical protein